MLSISDRPGLRNAELVGRMQTKLKNILQSILVPQHHSTTIFTELCAITADLRTLNTLHTEKFLQQARVIRDELVAVNGGGGGGNGVVSSSPPTSSSPIPPAAGGGGGQLHHQLSHLDPAMLVYFAAFAMASLPCCFQSF